ncbi:uncharacterized protein LOC121636413 [Melanotaenia boesemani]|uniref:uncharacterized protein LOC121636413 n=1 Tax=Melanotaenia boesemani TaxID=1250792 RepID=UPI001C040102|nr:uncharacterized protein LOC121636413 [Melanotaenia boesemani]
MFNVLYLCLLQHCDESVYRDDGEQQPDSGARSSGCSNKNTGFSDEESDSSIEDSVGSEDNTGSSSEEENMEWSEEDIHFEGTEEEMAHGEGSDKSNVDDAQYSWFTYFILQLTMWKSHFTISDNAYIALLDLLRSFLFTVGSIFRLDILKNLAERVPSTMYMVRKILSLKKDDFTHYVACPVCNEVYTLEEATIIVKDGRGIRKKSARCSHVTFRKHAQKRHRKECGTLLLKTVTGKKGLTYLHPKRSFCYRNVTKSLQDLVHRPGFNESCEKWRQRDMSDNIYADVYDGKVWKDFQSYNGKPFLSEARNLGLMLNVDWFQPYDRVKDSIGVMYLVVMNLPREERFKQENIIIAGIIPGPREPKEHINPYLGPLVSDLYDLWKGVYLLDSSALGKQQYRAALLCLSSDIPASRKTGGFLGHMGFPWGGKVKF